MILTKVKLNGMLNLILYFDVDSLSKELTRHRLNWVLDFMDELAFDVLKEPSYRERLNLYDVLCLEQFVKGKILSNLKKVPTDVSTGVYRFLIAQKLYDLFKVCRKLKKEDRDIVIYNYLETRIYYENTSDHSKIL